jgi:hypothetical protein
MVLTRWKQQIAIEKPTFCLGWRWSLAEVKVYQRRMAKRKPKRHWFTHKKGMAHSILKAKQGGDTGAAAVQGVADFQDGCEAEPTDCAVCGRLGRPGSPE